MGGRVVEGGSLEKYAGGSNRKTRAVHLCRVFLCQTHFLEQYCSTGKTPVFGSKYPLAGVMTPGRYGFLEAHCVNSCPVFPGNFGRSLRIRPAFPSWLPSCDMRQPLTY